MATNPNKFSKCAYFKLGTTDVTAYLAGVPRMRVGVNKQDLTTGAGDGTRSGGELESNGLEFALYNDAADVIGALIRPLHTTYVDCEWQYGDPASPGTAGSASRDDVMHKAEIFLEVEAPVPAGPVGGAEMWTFQADVQGAFEEDTTA